MRIAIDHIKDRRNFKRVYHLDDTWYIAGDLLIVGGKVIGSVDWYMTRQCEHEFFAWLVDKVDQSWNEKKYHVFTSKKVNKMTDEEVQIAVYGAIQDAQKEDT